MKNLNQIDLNLLVYLDALLRETERDAGREPAGAVAAGHEQTACAGCGQLFDDPLLVRTSEGMTPTERALELEPVVRERC